ncbi:hypothetical protein IWZ00DRAFT_197945 [Phyllosticta capitalensis]
MNFHLLTLTLFSLSLSSNTLLTLSLGEAQQIMYTIQSLGSNFKHLQLHHHPPHPFPIRPSAATSTGFTHTSGFLPALCLVVVGGTERKGGAGPERQSLSRPKMCWSWLTRGEEGDLFHLFRGKEREGLEDVDIDIDIYYGGRVGKGRRVFTFGSFYNYIPHGSCQNSCLLCHFFCQCQHCFCLLEALTAINKSHMTTSHKNKR